MSFFIRLFASENMSSKQSSPSAGNRGRHLRFESLEERELLSLTVPSAYHYNSYEAADKVIFLDFDGDSAVYNEVHNNTRYQWNAGKQLTTRAFSFDADYNNFSQDELTAIRDITMIVGEYFSPFSVNVTNVYSDSTMAAIRSGNGIRIVVGGDGSWGGGTGLALNDTFFLPSDIPGFAFSEQVNDFREYYQKVESVAQTITHETGHTLGLNHDGDAQGEYCHGILVTPGASGARAYDRWTPMMGGGKTMTYLSNGEVLFVRQVHQWSKGEYAGATNTEDDLAKLAASLGERPDDVGAGGANLIDPGNGTLYTKGVIGRGDTDKYVFNVTGTGTVNFDILAGVTIDSYLYSSLYFDVVVTGNGKTITKSADFTTLRSTFSETLEAGSYEITIRPAAISGVTSAYGSIGTYTVKIDGNVGTPSALKAPVLNGSSAGSGVNLSWTNVGATYYGVWRFSDGDWTELVPQTAAVTYSDSSLPDGTYTYVVYAYKGSETKMSNTFTVELSSGTGSLGTPTLTAVTGTGGVNLSWTDVGATRYGVWRLTGGNWTAVAAQTAATSLTDTGAGVGTHQYVVYAYKGSEQTMSNISSVTVTGDPGTPLEKPVLAASVGGDGVKLSWTNVGASYYGVWRLTGETWTAVAAQTTAVSLTDTGAGVGTHQYVVYAYKGSEQTISNAPMVTVTSGTSLGTPTLTAVSGTGGVNLSWTDVGATHYGVWRLTDDTWTAVAAQTTAVSLTDTGAGVGTHQYVVYAYKGSEQTMSNIPSVVVGSQLLSPKLTATSLSNGNVYLSWTNVGATHYSVWRLVDGNWTNPNPKTTANYFEDDNAFSGQYSYVVYAYNETGQSMSNVETVSTYMMGGYDLIGLALDEFELIEV